MSISYYLTTIFAFILLLSSLSALTIYDYNFNDGTYSNTAYSSESVILDSTSGNYYTSGYFLSKIFDISYDGNFTNFSWTTDYNYGKNLPDNAVDSDINMSGNILLYHMDSIDGSNYVADASGNSNNLLTSSASVSSASRFDSNSLLFNGSATGIALNSASLDANNFSFEFWFKPLTNTAIKNTQNKYTYTLASRLSKDSPATLNGFDLGLDSNLKPYIATMNIADNNITKWNNAVPDASDTTSTYGRIPLGTAGKGDVNGIWSADVIYDNGTYKMWYSGRLNSLNLGIYYATSPDGNTWTKLNNANALSNTTGTDGRIPRGSSNASCDDVRAYRPSVIKDGSTYKAWYIGQVTGYCGSTGISSSVCYATSSDGLTWTKSCSSYQYTASYTDNNAILFVDVIKDGASSYKMYYGTARGDGNWKTFMATSTNGTSWTAVDQTVESPSDTIGTNGRIPLGTAGKGDDKWAFPGKVIKENGLYIMFYGGVTTVDGLARTYMAVSNDGYTWYKVNNTIPTASNTTGTYGRLPFGATGGDVSQATVDSVIRVGNKYLLYYAGQASSSANVTYYTAEMPVGVLGSTSIADNNWHHFVGVKNDTNLSLYIDGALVGSTTTPVTNLSNDANLLIGNDFNGYIDELAYYNRALSASEITSRFKRGASTLKFQIKSCNDAECSGETFVGDDNTESTYFNDSNVIYNLNLQTNRYFQYKSFFDTLVTNTSLSSTPVLYDVNIDYVPLAPTITINSLDGITNILNHSYSDYADGNLTIDFNIQYGAYSDVNYELILVGDTNTTISNGLLSDICDVTDLSTGINCTYDFNASSYDGNYSISISAFDPTDETKISNEQTDYFNLDNISTTTTLSYTTSISNLIANISISCSDLISGCNNTYYRLDSDPSPATSFGSWGIVGSNPEENRDFYLAKDSLIMWLDLNDNATLDNNILNDISSNDYNVKLGDGTTSTTFPTFVDENTGYSFDGTTDYLSNAPVIYGNNATYESLGLYHNFEEGTGTTIYDEIAGATATLNSGASFVAGKNGSYAINFDGSDDSVTGTYASNQNYGSISFWIYQDAITVKDMFRYSNTSGKRIYIYSTNSGNNLNFVFDSGATYIVSCASCALSTTWYMLTMTWTDYNLTHATYSVYKNTTLLGTTIAPKNSYTTYSLGKSTSTWNGRMDDFRIYNIALDLNQITQLYNKNAQNYYYNEKDYWSFENGTSSIAYNSWGTNNLDIESNVDLVSGYKGDYALYFDGTQTADYNWANLNSGMQSYNKTISFWAKPNNYDSSVYVVGTNTEWFNVGFASNNRMVIRYKNLAGTISTEYSENNVYDVNQWQHFAYVFANIDNNYRLRFYVDGTLVKTTSTTNGFDTNYGSYITLGNNSFNGYIDELKFYNINLDNTTINELYSKELRLFINNGVGKSYNDVSLYDKLLRPGKYAGYLSFLGVWNETENIEVNASVEGNYAVEYYSEDIAGNVESTQSTNIYIKEQPLKIRSYNSDFSLPLSYYKVGETIGLDVYKKNNYVNPLISVLDNDGVVLYQDLNYVSEDSNIFRFTFDLNNSASYGWLDVNVDGFVFNNVAYNSEIWSTPYEYDGNYYPFTFDLNVANNNNFDVWYDVIDADVNFSYYAKESSIRVLEYRDGNYFEIPSQIYNAIGDSNYISSGNIVFLPTIKANTTNNYFISYAKSDINKIYTSDINFYGSDYNYAEVDDLQMSLNTAAGGLIKTFKQKFYNGSSATINESSRLMLSPRATTIETNYNSYTTTGAITLDVNGPIFSRYKVNGTTSSLLGFNYEVYFKMYANNSRLDINNTVESRSNNNWSEYQDLYYTINNLYSKFGYFTNDAYTESNIDKSGSSGSLSDLTDVNAFVFYDANNSYGVGTIFKSRNFTDASYLDVSDGLANESVIRTFLLGNIDANDIFNSENVLVVFNSYLNLDDFNEYYYKVTNPITFTQGATTSSDTEDPVISDYNYIPQDINDSTQITCYATVSDNLQVDYVTINLIGPDTNEIETINVDSDLADVNATFSVNAGDYNCIFIAYDIANNTATAELTSINVSDTTPPSIYSINTLPDSNTDIDPNTLITIDANIKDYSGLTDVNLYYRTYDLETYSDWNNIEMSCALISDYNYNCQATFTTDAEELIYEYLIYASDGTNDINSSTYTIYSYYDRSWYFDTNVDNVAVVYDTNHDVGTINIYNTGDYEITFVLDSNYYDSDSVYFDDCVESSVCTYTIAADANQSILLKMTARSFDTGVVADVVDINIDVNTESVTPDYNNLTFSFTSYPGGAYIVPSFTSSTISVNPGDTNASYNIKISNIGDTTCHQGYYEFSLPTGFTINTGDSNLDEIILDGYSYNLYSTIMSISSDINNGTKTITLNAGCLDNDQNTSTSTNVVVGSSTTTTITNTTQIVSGGGGSSGGSGGGAPVRLQELQKANQLFQTNETISIVRGSRNTFNIKINNPFDDVNIVNTKITATGVLARYIEVVPSTIKNVPAGKSYNVEVRINAPTYFETGTNILNFDIVGQIQGITKRKDNVEYVGFEEKRQVILKILDMSVDDANQYVDLAKKVRLELKDENYYVGKIDTLINILDAAYAKEDYAQVKTITDQINNLANIAKQINANIDKMQKLVNQANSKGIATPDTQKLLNLAANKMSRGDFDSAKLLMSQIDLTYALETKNEISYKYYLKTYWYLFLLGFLLLSLLGLFTYLMIQRVRYKARLKKLDEEEDIIMFLIKETQKKCFIDNKMSVEEYKIAVEKYEERITNIVTEYIEVRNKMKLFFNRTKALNMERDELLSKIEQLQRNYFYKNDINPGTYNVKFKSLIKRVGEIEAELADEDVKKEVGRFRWKG